MQKAPRYCYLCVLYSNISFTACTTAVQMEVKHNLLLKDHATAGPRFCALTQILFALHYSPVGQGGSSCAGEFQKSRVPMVLALLISSNETTL